MIDVNGCFRRYSYFSMTYPGATQGQAQAAATGDSLAAILGWPKVLVNGTASGVGYFDSVANDLQAGDLIDVYSYVDNAYTTFNVVSVNQTAPKVLLSQYTPASANIILSSANLISLFSTSAVQYTTAFPLLSGSPNVVYGVICASFYLPSANDALWGSAYSVASNGAKTYTAYTTTGSGGVASITYTGTGNSISTLVAGGGVTQAFAISALPGFKTTFGTLTGATGTSTTNGAGLQLGTTTVATTAGLATGTAPLVVNINYSLDYTV